MNSNNSKQIEIVIRNFVNLDNGCHFSGWLPYISVQWLILYITLYNKTGFIPPGQGGNEMNKQVRLESILLFLTACHDCVLGLDTNKKIV